MHYLPSPPNPVRSQMRIDVSDAGNPGSSTAGSLQASVFDATNLEAAPYLGSLVGNAGFSAISFLTHFTLDTFSLDPYIGKTVYFAYRSSNNADFAYATALTYFCD